MARNKQKKRGLAPPPSRAAAHEEEDMTMQTEGGDAEAGKRVRGGAAGEGRQEKESKDNLRFEDPFEDEFEEEEEVYEESDEDEEGEGMDVGGEEAAYAAAASAGRKEKKGKKDKKKGKGKKKQDGAAAGGGGDAMDEDEEEQQVETKVWTPGVDQLAEGEELEYDPSAYVMYHCLTPEWPCLSFDILKDNLGGGRTRFPVTMYAVCGTQADRADANKLTVMKLSEMHKTYRKSADDSDSDDDDDEDDEEGADVDPLLEQRSVPHRGGVNRVRTMPQSASVVATWADTGHVHLWDLAPVIRALDNPAAAAAAGPHAGSKPVFSFGGHKDEGFAMDWSRVQAGRLATGDNAGSIHVWQGGEGASWQVLDQKQPYRGHASSVEDIQWSPTEASVFLSCSADQTLKVWDVRNKSGAMLSVQAHDADVNVCSWNRNVAYLAVTGADDGSFKVWDLRQFQKGQPIAHFTWHKGPITSVEWHPQDESILACASEDDTVTIWDLSVEEDEEVAAQRAADATIAHLPPQLLFVHQGQKEVKELHFHAQVPGLLMTTAMDGFNVFKPAIGL